MFVFIVVLVYSCVIRESSQYMYLTESSPHSELLSGSLLNALVSYLFNASHTLDSLLSFNCSDHTGLSFIRDRPVDCQ